ncbi:MAG: hypothetical protein JNL58_08875 [Planctomyces sp.]|nr:hypothetical protein [Planctomyces sp.]
MRNGITGIRTALTLVCLIIAGSSEFTLADEQSALQEKSDELLDSVAERPHGATTTEELQEATVALTADFEKPIAYWLEMLRENPGPQSQHASVTLSLAAQTIAVEAALSAGHRKEVVDQLFGRQLLDPVQRKSFAARFQVEFQMLLEEMIEQYRVTIEEPESSERQHALAVIALCMAVSHADGSGIARARQVLPPGAQSDALIRELLLVTPYTLPADQEVGPVIIREVQTLSDETLCFAEAEWHRIARLPISEEPFQQIGLGFFPLGLLTGLSGSDRILSEMDFCLEFLKPEYPSLFRCAALACLAEFGCLAESAQPEIEAMFHDDEFLIRWLAAATWIATSVETLRKQDFERIADEARLGDPGKQQLLLLFEEQQEHRAEERRSEQYLLASLDEHVHQSMLNGSKSSRLWILKAIRRNPTLAARHESFVRECLTDNLPQIRHSANLALKALHTN